MSEATLTLLTLAGVVVLFVTNKVPVGVSAAAQLDISARPVLMSLCDGAAVAFLTPVATPANMMVMGPAGYRFGDYWKLGLPLTILFGLVSVLLVPVIWPF